MNKWLEWMHSDEYAELSEAEEKALAEHWANDLLDAPHALIAMIETKIARAVIGREREITKEIEKLPFFIYHAVANNGRILDEPCSPVMLEREAVLALIKGEQK